MISTPDSKNILEKALESFLRAVSEDIVPQCLYQFYYEQATGATQQQPTADGATTFQFSVPSVTLAFEDSALRPVPEAWRKVMGAEAAADAQYMTFPPREGEMDDEDA